MTKETPKLNAPMTTAAFAALIATVEAPQAQTATFDPAFVDIAAGMVATADKIRAVLAHDAIVTAPSEANTLRQAYARNRKALIDVVEGAGLKQTIRVEEVVPLNPNPETIDTEAATVAATGSSETQTAATAKTPSSATTANSGGKTKADGK